MVTDRMFYIAEPVFPQGDPRNDLTSGPTGSPGRYRITVILAVPGQSVVQESVDFHSAVQRGDSLLQVSTEVTEFSPEVAGLDNTQTLVVHANDQQRLRDAAIELDADGFHDAARRGHDIAMPLLSRWSYVHDVAIGTSGTLIEELATGTARFEATIVGAVKRFSEVRLVSTPELRLLLAAYREGLSAAEPLWRALSLYKVAEGVWALRAFRAQSSLAAGLSVEQPSERVPTDVSALGHPNDHDQLARSLAPYAGKKFRVAMDDIRASLRNAIAHLDPDAPLAQDNWDDVERVEAVLPGLRWMSRALLSAEIAEEATAQAPPESAAS
jgi:hypothetical protein